MNERAGLPIQLDFMQAERSDRCLCDTNYPWTVSIWDSWTSISITVRLIEHTAKLSTYHAYEPTPVKVIGEVGNGKWLND